jgi:hypothetical protein
MINLTCISRAETEDLDAIISEKNDNEKTKALIRLKKEILLRYGKYNDIEKNKRIKKASFDADDIQALHSLYINKTRTSRKIAQEVLGSPDAKHSDCCLYCGIGEIDQIDHFLPFQHFPEFSILHKNLIPSCGRCNELKSDFVPGIDGKDFLHMVYDKLPSEYYYECKIEFLLGNTPTVEFSVIEKFEDQLVGIHFRDLELKKRLKKKGVQYFLQILALKTEFGLAFASEELDRDHKKYQVFHGNFFWKTVLIEEMLNVGFLNNV